MKSVFAYPGHGGGQAPALRYRDGFCFVVRSPRAFSLDRSMAGDRPPPYGMREVSASTVARGPVPRDRSISKSVFLRPQHGGGQAPALRYWGRYKRTLLYKIRPVQNPLTRIILNIRTKSTQIRLIPNNMLMEITMPDFFTKTRPTQ